MGHDPVLSRGPAPHPPLFQTLVAPALFQTFVTRQCYMMDLVASGLLQKPVFVTNFVARGAPRPCYKAEGFDPLPCYYFYYYYYSGLSSTSLLGPGIWSVPSDWPQVNAGGLGSGIAFRGLGLRPGVWGLGFGS